jgi:hypothetical protein
MEAAGHFVNTLTTSHEEHAFILWYSPKERRERHERNQNSLIALHQTDGSGNHTQLSFSKSGFGENWSKRCTTWVYEVHRVTSVKSPTIEVLQYE